MADKPTLRRLARLLSPATLEEGDRVAEHVLGVMDSPLTGCIYLPMPGELDVTSVVDRRADIEWFTTRTVDRTTLSVHPFDSEYEVHPFGYRQPVEGSVEADAGDIDLWLVPGLAFDMAGHRLGHGMGYYDRLLAAVGPEARLMGVTLERRIFPTIPTDRFDVPMHLVVTEARVISP